MPRRMISLIFPAIVIAAAGMHPERAAAICQASLGCSDRDPFSNFDLSLMSCENLGILRNGIFADNGYCFGNPKYRRIFRNTSCRYDSSGDVPLNGIERANISAIIAVEREKGC